MKAMPLDPFANYPRGSGRRRVALIVAAVVVVLTAAGGAVWAARRRTTPNGNGSPAAVAAAPDDSLAHAPANTRVKVMVVNATRTRGLARRATQLLRDRGFDVVEVSTTGTLRDSTLVLDHSGHADWAQRVARAMGGARTESRPDTSRYLDLTVLVGRAWRPAPEPFYP